MKRTALRRGTSQLKRTGRIKQRIPPDRGNPTYRAFIREFPCEVAMCQGWPTDCAHVRSRGAGGKDEGNTIPLCRAHHQQQHTVGVVTFAARHGLNLRNAALRYVNLYAQAVGRPTTGEAR